MAKNKDDVVKNQNDVAKNKTDVVKNNNDVDKNQTDVPKKKQSYINLSGKARIMGQMKPKRRKKLNDLKANNPTE